MLNNVTAVLLPQIHRLITITDAVPLPLLNDCINCKEKLLTGRSPVGTNSTSKAQQHRAKFYYLYFSMRSILLRV